MVKLGHSGIETDSSLRSRACIFSFSVQVLWPVEERGLAIFTQRSYQDLLIHTQNGSCPHGDIHFCPYMFTNATNPPESFRYVTANYRIPLNLRTLRRSPSIIILP